MEEKKVSWQEIYHKLDPKEPLEQGDSRLCEKLYGGFLTRVCNRILLDKNKNQKILLSGHIGCGKSTFLNLLQVREEIVKEFFPVKYSIKDVLDPNDIDHIDLMLSFVLQTLDAASGMRIKVKKDLIDRVRNLALELIGLIQREKAKERRRSLGAGVAVEAGLPSLISFLKANFFARFKIENETRELVREHYRPRMTDFLNTINDILTKIQISLKDKNLLILVDDTDKIPPERALKIFFENGQHLSNPHSNIIFMIDTSISCSSKYATIVNKIGIEEFFPAIKLKEMDGTESQATGKNLQMLLELARKRMPGEFIEDAVLIKAAEMSGGVVREFIRILQEAIFYAEGKVQSEHIEQAAFKIRNGYNLYADHTRILKSILKEPMWLQTMQEEFAKIESFFLDLLYMPALFQYRDGAKWYKPYPIFIPWLEKLE
jgi:energy-coupling factor transporter ATP-binding protein EcfA2